MIFDIDFGGSNSAAVPTAPPQIFRLCCIPGFDAEVTEKILNCI